MKGDDAVSGDDEAMTVERHDTVRRLAPEYEALFEESADQSLFLSLSWFKNFERTVMTDQQMPMIYGLRAPSRSGAPWRPSPWPGRTRERWACPSGRSRRWRTSTRRPSASSPPPTSMSRRPPIDPPSPCGTIAARGTSSTCIPSTWSPGSSRHSCRPSVGWGFPARGISASATGTLRSTGDPSTTTSRSGRPCCATRSPARLANWSAPGSSPSGSSPTTPTWTGQ